MLEAKAHDVPGAWEHMTEVYEYAMECFNRVSVCPGSHLESMSMMVKALVLVVIVFLVLNMVVALV